MKHKYIPGISTGLSGGKQAHSIRVPTLISFVIKDLIYIKVKFLIYQDHQTIEL